MDSGIFSPMLPQRCIQMETTDDSGKRVTLYAKERLRHREKLDRRERYEIDTRGWTFQEFILPPRVLRYGKHDISWRCREACTCECELRGGINGSWSVIAARLDLKEPEKALEWWKYILTDYTSRHLSNSNDKLPALSGLAQTYRKATHDTYLAGLWKTSLLRDLLWYVEGIEGLGWRPAQYRAPSWSWASIDLPRNSKMAFFRTEGDMVARPVCTPLNVVCPLQTSDPFGRVGVCQLEIRVRLFRIMVTGNSKSRRLWGMSQIHGFMRAATCRLDSKMENDSLKEGDEVYCAPILEASETRICCLMLKQLQDRQYTRIGFCELGMQIHDWDHRTPEACFRIAEKLQKDGFELNADSLSSIVVL